MLVFKLLTFTGRTKLNGAQATIKTWQRSIQDRTQPKQLLQACDAGKYYTHSAMDGQQYCLYCLCSPGTVNTSCHNSLDKWAQILIFHSPLHLSEPAPVTPKHHGLGNRLPNTYQAQ